MNTAHHHMQTSEPSTPAPACHPAGQAPGKHSAHQGGASSATAHAHYHGGGNASLARLASSATLHCLTYLAAWPVNYWLLKRNVKKPCH